MGKKSAKTIWMTDSSESPQRSQLGTALLLGSGLTQNGDSSECAKNNHPQDCRQLTQRRAQIATSTETAVSQQNTTETGLLQTSSRPSSTKAAKKTQSNKHRNKQAEGTALRASEGGGDCSVTATNAEPGGLGRYPPPHSQRRWGRDRGLRG